MKKTNSRKRKLFRAKAPLRIGLAGGGTDVSPYSDDFGGAILNATINMYAYATIKPRNDGKIIFHSLDMEEREVFSKSPNVQTDDGMKLLKAVYNRIVKDYNNGEALSFELITSVDAPIGSGLGTSSTLVVAIIKVFAEWLDLPLGEYDIAKLAFEIERIDLGFSGGKQDQYAAAFGGVNFMEFQKDNRVIVNPLRLKDKHFHEFSFNILMYYTGTSRLSSKIIDAQANNVKSGNEKSIQAMHDLKEQAHMLKEALLKGDFLEFGKVMDRGWEAKKKMTEGISNRVIDEIYVKAKESGVLGAKISGAGGGGFMFLLCPGNIKFKVKAALEKLGGQFYDVELTTEGAQSWSIEL